MPSKTILVVDDEKDTLVFLANTLRRLDYEVITTSRGLEAVELVKNQRPDLILLDVVMPDISGEDVADILSRDPLTADIPIVFLTGIVTKQEEPLLKKTGKRYLLAKPITVEEIHATIQKIIE
jgi:CheY-like chemotaxis protein|tara:strand:- start:380 stop:748 length:369 start_codon:yes stop_codon:yes gene_type:complete